MLTLEQGATLAALLEIALAKVAPQIPDADVEAVREYIAHDEYGLAFELPRDIIVEDGLPLDASLLEVGRLMGFPAASASSGDR